MIRRILSALIRALLVVAVMMLPALLLPDIGGADQQLSVLIAFLLGCLTFAEYGCRAPSVVAFRDAAPINRLRFATLFATVLTLTLVYRDPTGSLAATGTTISHMIPPALLIRPPGGLGMQSMVSLALVLSWGGVLMMLILAHLRWPWRDGALNLWINLPLFHPGTQDTIAQRLTRRAWIQIALGLALPLLLPVMAKLGGMMLDPQTPLTLIWTLSAWAFLPASLTLRGIAILAIATRLDQKDNQAGPARSILPMP